MGEYWSELVEVMQEPPDGAAGSGRSARVLSSGENDAMNRRWRDLAPMGWPGPREFWGVERATAHRGILHPSEHIDLEALTEKVEQLLGFTADEVREAFAPGRPTSERLELRARVDARLLTIAE